MGCFSCSFKTFPTSIQRCIAALFCCDDISATINFHTSLPRTNIFSFQYYVTYSIQTNSVNVIFTSEIGDLLSFFSNGPMMNLGGRQSAKRKTAYEVFMAFIQTKPEVNVSRLFTYECYHTWLITRKSKIKHPEQTFQRTLIAHLKGSDKRRPFPAEIETKILELLRDNERNIFDAIFYPNEFGIGKKKFLANGFHERNSLGLPPAKRKKKDQSEPPKISNPGVKSEGVSESLE